MLAKNEISLFKNPIVWLIFTFLLALKLILFRCYHSTDFEVHRNWMAITYHLPIDQWYRSNISQWTLDYPPFFAYFEWILSKIAAQFDIYILILQAEPYFSTNALIFQRLTVIAGDIVYFIACVSIANTHIKQSWAKGEEFRKRLSIGFYSFLISIPALLLLDNIHFQYNAFLYGIFLLSLSAIFSDKILQGALLFAILLNFKHIYLYYVPAFVAFYFSNYLMPLNTKFPVRCFNLGLVIGSIFIISFGPFLFHGGSPLFRQILSRLFPFKRGLTHANWAPNFWVLYNLVDSILAKATIMMAEDCSKFPWNSILKTCPPPPPEYTRGLVKEYAHSLLPNITPSITLALILAALTPCFCIFAKKNINRIDQFLLALTLSAYSFFYFGWHVHEKAILMVFFPMALLAIKDLRFIEPFALLSIASTFAQFPLFFTPLENIAKWTISLAHFALSIFLAKIVWRLHPGELLRSSTGRLLAILAFISELYALFGHKLFFAGGQFQFLPIIFSSLTCSLMVLHSYLALILTVFADEWCIQLKRKQIVRKEGRILQSDAEMIASNVHHIAGIDVSICQTQPSLGVVSLTLLAYPSMEVVFCADEFVLLAAPFGGIPPYIPEFLALREAGPLRRALLRHMPSCPKLDVLFVDSNGKWHSRGCGLACHVGFDMGLCTVGVAKNFIGFPLVAHGLCEIGELKEIQSRIEQNCGKSSKGATLFQLAGLDQKCPQLAVIRTKSSKIPLFISAGFGVDIERAAEIAFCCFGRNSAAVNPIRMSDLRSRQRIEDVFER